MSTATKDYVLLSKKGLHELRHALQQREHDRQDVIRRLKELDKTTGHDDRFTRNEHLAQLEAIETDIAEKRHILTKAKLMPSRRARARVALGSAVDLIDQQGRLFRYTLVDSIEANPSDGRISIQSPLGSTLLGKTVRDVIEWSGSSRQSALQLVRIY